MLPCSLLPAALLPCSPLLLPAAFRIAVTGGPWEFAHNQLCFFNHYAQLEGQGLFTYVPLLDRLIEPERNLRDIDAVIISAAGMKICARCWITASGSRSPRCT